MIPARSALFAAAWLCIAPCALAKHLETSERGARAHAHAPTRAKTKPSNHRVVASRPKKKKKRRPIRRDPPNATWLKYKRSPWRRGYVSVVGHGKQWSGYLVDAAGDVPPLARKELSEALASWRTGKWMLIDEHLMQLIADVSDEFGGRPIRLVSGYREQSWAQGSKHKVGQAFDFSIPGVPNALLKDYLRSLPDVGVGYYPNSTHVHLDVRDKPTYWVDYSAPGQPPDYAYARRVAGLTPAEHALAAALDALRRDAAPNGERHIAAPASTPMMRVAPASSAAFPAPRADDEGDDEREPNDVVGDGPPKPLARAIP